MKYVNWQFKFFLYWFVIFFISVIAAMTTQSEIAINASLALLVLIGFVMLITTGRDAVLSILSKSWPTVEFDVLDSRVSRSLSPGEGVGMKYKANFELGYRVLSRSYRLPCNILNVPYHNTEEEAEKYIQEVKDGKYGKSVHYNPSSPAQAYVKPGLRLQHLLAILLGFGFILVPMGFMLGYITV